MLYTDGHDPIEQDKLMKQEQGRVIGGAKLTRRREDKGSRTQTEGLSLRVIAKPLHHEEELRSQGGCWVENVENMKNKVAEK